MRINYFDFLYGNSNVIREYIEDGTYELVRDHSLDNMDREASRAERKKPPIQIVKHQTQQNIILN